MSQPTLARVERVLSQAAVRYFARDGDEDVEVTLLAELGEDQRGFVLTVGDEAVRVVVEELSQ